MSDENVKPHAIFACDHEAGGADGAQIAWVEPANPNDVQELLREPMAGHDHRSPWFWMRLQDGTLLLGTFPQGGTYERFSDGGVCDWQEPAAPEPLDGPTIQLSFNAQAWVRDYAMSVDPEGDTVWQVPKDEFLKQFPTESHFNHDHYRRDGLRHEGNAPKWVRDWSGPFEVELVTPAESIWENEP